MACPKSFAELDAVYTWHVDIEHDEPWPKALGQLACFEPLRGAFEAYRGVGGQYDVTQLGGEDWVVVHEQRSRLLCVAFCRLALEANAVGVRELPRVSSKKRR